MNSNWNYIGRGSYTLAEASRLTMHHHSTISTWIRNRSDGQGLGPVFEPDFQIIDNKVYLTFYDLIDISVVGALRNLKVPMNEIRSCYDKLSQKLTVKHPFCHQSLLTDGSKIIIENIDNEGEKHLLEVITEQELFHQVKDVLHSVRYDEKKIASIWDIHKGVAIDPTINWGKPVVIIDNKISGISSLILAYNYIGNNFDEKFVADQYEIDSSQVMNAVDFEKKYNPSFLKKYEKMAA